MSYEIKKEFIYSTAETLVNYIDQKYGIETDIHDVAQLINDGLGFIFDLSEDIIKEL